MYSLIVDGSFCPTTLKGGVGGYILDSNRHYKTHFQYKLESKVVYKYFEILAIISGLNLALENNIDKIQVFSDDVDLIKSLTAKNFSFKKSISLRDALFHKLQSILTQFTTVTFAVYKCHHAHDLSRIYLGDKNEADIVKQIKIIKTLKKGQKSARASKVSILKTKSVTVINQHVKINSPIKKPLNMALSVSVSTSNKTPKLKAYKVDCTNMEIYKINNKSSQNDNGTYFLDFKEAKKIYIFPIIDTQKSYSYNKTALKNAKIIDFNYDSHLQILTLVHDGHLLLKKEISENLIHFLNYCICFLSRCFKNCKLHFNFINLPDNYSKLLWSQLKIQDDDASSFKLIVNFLLKNNCTQISYLNHSS